MDLALSKARTVRVQGPCPGGKRPGKAQYHGHDRATRFQCIFRRPTVAGDRPRRKFRAPRGEPRFLHRWSPSFSKTARCSTGRQPAGRWLRQYRERADHISSGMDLAGQVRIDGPTTASVSDMRITLRSGEPGPMMMMTPNARIKDDGTFLLDRRESGSIPTPGLRFAGWLLCEIHSDG